MPLALITGAARANSIAAGIAPRLVADGWQVVTSDLHGADYDCDLAQAEAPGQLVERVTGDHGPIGALVLSHAHDVLSGILDTTAESFDQHVAVNARASLLLIASFARQVPDGGGAIVALTSDATTGNLPYGASKGALDRIVISAARELGPLGISANVVNPGPIDTGRLKVLDLGAGTGRLSSVLLTLGADVVAVEPDDAMRALVPSGAQSMRGTAEQVPLPDESVDAVLVGQAWHWFDAEPALAEVRRVLRPGGVLGLLWNVFDDRVPWVGELVTAAAAEDRLSATDDAAPYDGAPVPERRQFAHAQQMTRDMLVANMASRSRTVLMARGERDALLGRVHDMAPAEAFELPWVCDVWRARMPDRPVSVQSR